MYSLEPPRQRGSNEYPHSMFFSRNKKNNVYPRNPLFDINVGFKGVKIYRYVFVMFGTDIPGLRSVRRSVRGYWQIIANFSFSCKKIRWRVKMSANYFKLSFWHNEMDACANKCFICFVVKKYGKVYWVYIIYSFLINIIDTSILSIIMNSTKITATL